MGSAVSDGNECLNREWSMLEVKRKPNESQTTRASTAALLGYQSHRQIPPTPVSDNLHTPHRSEETARILVPVQKERSSFQTRTPVIIGEACFKGMLPVDGIVTGQPGAQSGSLGIKQRTASSFGSRPELSGELSFRDMLRVNGHIAGTVYSKTGTLIVDNTATVDSNIEVAIAIISGTVRGDIVARERVELGPGARIYGNIWTRTIAIKEGAVFDGVCTMIEARRA